MSGIMADSVYQVRPLKVGFLLLPEFSMISVFSAIEPLRIANRLQDERLYSWHIFSEDGAPVVASNGFILPAEAPIGRIDHFPLVLVCASFSPERYASRGVINWLRRLDRRGAVLGGMETGAHVLAAAGLLEGRRVALHWENIPAFAERFPGIEVTEELFEAGGRRLTCAGGVAALDLMLHLIAEGNGRDLAYSVSEQLLHSPIRAPGSGQRMALGERLGVSHRKLGRIVEAMRENLEDPLSLEQLAAVGGVSRRQLERLFRSHLGATPSGYYLRLRLERARGFLEQTDMSVLDVALACGFLSAPYFSRAYRAHFGHAPRDDRRRLRGAVGRTGWMAEGL